MGNSSPSHLDIYDAHITILRAAFARHEYEPLALSLYRVGPTLLLAGYLLLPPSSSVLVRHARFPVFLVYAYSCIESLLWTRTSSYALAYIMGASFAFGPLWTLNLLILRDARLEARRVERRPVQREKSEPTGAGVTTSENGTVDAQGLRERKKHREASPVPAASSTDADYEYFWQGLPTDFLTRLGWVTDLSLALRGAGWTHQIRTIPGPPPSITASLPSFPRLAPGVPRPASKRALLRRQLAIFFTHYLLLDVLKVLTMHDPYFMTLGAAAPLPPDFPSWLETSSLLLRLTRIFM